MSALQAGRQADSSGFVTGSVVTLYDSHCHFETTDPEAIAATLVRASAVGVGRILAVGGSVSLNAGAVAAAKCAPSVRLALGYDREQIDAERPAIPDDLPLAAWGEIGLDYHYSPDTRSAQMALFAEQLEEARRRDLPVVIHTREADDDTVALLRETRNRGVIHCYTGTPQGAKRFLDLGFYVSISGIVTFKAADNVREAAMAIPLNRLLIETDSPFLAPVPMRGKTNEPAFVTHTCAFLAKLHGIPAEEMAALTYANAASLFG